MATPNYGYEKRQKELAKKKKKEDKLKQKAERKVGDPLGDDSTEDNDGTEPNEPGADGSTPQP
ncbi:MAG: hypothetical protein KA173_07020 [Rhodoferax sp.]|nr:hypothetical protein [Rhodoferax sp.]MBP7492017.1 hypothetical protein [Rhodoferax sp.]